MPSKKKNPHSGPMPPPDPDLPDPVPDNTQRKRYYNNGEHIYYVPVGGDVWRTGIVHVQNASTVVQRVVDDEDGKEHFIKPTRIRTMPD
ncbi:hypothetical protein XANCAGTX0491_007688 [Xanthoria calcicola]